MIKKSTLLSVDAFGKTEEDVRVRTRTGGLITVSCIFVTLILLINEWKNFNTIVNRPELVVDRDRHLKLDLNLDVTFPNMPCNVLNLDILDDSGEFQLNLLESGFTKIRISPEGKELNKQKFEVGENSPTKDTSTEEGYCGPCYGARDQSKNDELPADQRVCCQTCEDVRNAYSENGWAFKDGQGVEQCEREGYVQSINKRINEGCRVQGRAQLNRIQGSIHFGPGKSMHNFRGHFHDTSLYEKHSHLNFNHIINKLTFGETPSQADSLLLNSVSLSPLDGREVLPERDTHLYEFSYFCKIIPTRFEFLDGKKVETTQFSSTYHDRPLRGGRDEDHPTTVHSAGGVPGLFFNFEMSPLKVINREEHAISWSGFLLNCITSIGGVLAVGTVVDKITYRAQKTIWGKKSS
ncbi:ER-derived vesicles protein ERV46 [Kluyveromyces marxianus]|uniref:Endoplasmic reticulum-Golgi intermediate compartment protein n=2 Tax=Kluyveromyces marxianus TaxID=4911 RepID=W0TI96_KLUMD|nr:ER-derived vesicles protein ERV46 [Kluyveromyces marxianus DMKU3-1042]KAG0674030.1 ER-derived vesicles protein erv46 [Kluyveromyces marxianus]KAG0679985.1 ER-derived vesicles protein erv46 [Kluyveromyces marxianus]QGN17821.1 ER-derived vesicles protein ERV46 [Kluyveromyces marxianus]BAO42556.1 ER-derived vesicles protein ERV46 [Kluyveromyces marxianus DMKU3-1042]